MNSSEHRNESKERKRKRKRVDDDQDLVDDEEAVESSPRKRPKAPKAPKSAKAPKTGKRAKGTAIAKWDDLCDAFVQGMAWFLYTYLPGLLQRSLAQRTSLDSVTLRVLSADPGPKNMGYVDMIIFWGRNLH
jgi:hypothetical protein